ncbi:pilus assembly protein [Acidovorax radicis]|uniref:pilus assembly protein n=1 Tax=Acidovorax radicis TaxID=758826 RepID=UPI0002D2FB2F|nr:PilC/PilY family type IV pilus protein [Acidovorax radicis]
MKTPTHLQKTVLSILITSIIFPNFAFGASLNLAQYPAGTASTLPAPNVIVSVDNSGSMGAAGMLALRNALTTAFAPGVMPDGAIRLAYQSMWRCNTIPSIHADCAVGGVANNTMRELTGPVTPTDPSHRGQFYRWIATLAADAGTPTHQMMYNAGEYLKTTGANSPWNATPGTADAAPETCRRSYNILMTDGGWNNYDNTTQNLINAAAIGNVDGTAKTFPDGTVYSPTSDETRIYQDAFGDFGTSPRKPTLSDMAFHYWSQDLQPGITNNLSPQIKKAGAETFFDGATSQTVSEYWNPKNNPATWQHMQTYTIGFNAAANWPSTGTNPLFSVADGMYGGDFSRAIVGTRAWRNTVEVGLGDSQRQEDIWHMAINSRGKFYPATNAAALTAAFQDILNVIIADNSKPITTAAGSATTVARSDAGVFKAGYDAAKWTGYVRSDKVAAVTGTETANPGWGINVGALAPADRVTTAQKLDALSTVSNRVIYTTNDVTNSGVTFEWDLANTKLSATQKLMLDAGSLGENRVNFIRGDRTKEGATVTEPFRVRGSRQGDIVNSSIWYTPAPVSNFTFSGYKSFSSTNRKRIPMIYVGGNDGMLHGFSALDGEEKLAYIPKGVIKELTQLSDPGYSHRYYVDGSPFTGDANVAGPIAGIPDWRTLLVGTLAAGGKGYFILDVTKPGTTDGLIPSDFTNNSAGATVTVQMDKTIHPADVLLPTAEEADIGHIFAAPVVDPSNPYVPTQMVKLNDDRWAVILGNGYNSTNERPVLLIQYLDGAKELKRISAAAVGSAQAVQNGLSAPRMVDLNSDGKPDIVYAGDLRGNMWKFDISSTAPTSWGVALSGSPLYSAKDGTGNIQPITAPPTVKVNDRGAGGMMVAFGTGRSITLADRTDVSSQTFYSILDSTKYKNSSGGVISVDPAFPGASVAGRTSLVAQTVVSSASGSGVYAGNTFSSMSQNIVAYTGPSAKKGWYFDLPVSGERLLKPAYFYDGSNNLEVLSQVPASSALIGGPTCSPNPQAEKQYRTFLNIMDGRSPSVQLLDKNGDGYYNSGDAISGVLTARMNTTAGSKTNIYLPNKVLVKGEAGQAGGGGSPPLSKDDQMRLMPEQPLRPSWRQVQ